MLSGVIECVRDDRVCECRFFVDGGLQVGGGSVNR